MAFLENCLGQIDSIIADYSQLPRSATYAESIGYVTRVRAAVQRIAGKSPYQEQCDDVLAEDASIEWKVDALHGVLRALRSDVAAGYLETASSLIHGEVFADFLDMAQHLAEEGYHDAAAVIAGSALEAHLRSLCAAGQVEILGASGRPKKADALNADLARSGAYGVLDQKLVTGWLDLRNNAAHGLYDAYSPEQVKIMIAGVQEFMARRPA